MNDLAGVHVLIQGHVQGVGYRYFVSEEAQKRDLTGWVRNLDRGDVEVYAEGSQKTLDEFLLMLERGPRMAHVQQMTVDWQAATGSFNKFSIAPTGL